MVYPHSPTLSLSFLPRHTVPTVECTWIYTPERVGKFLTMNGYVAEFRKEEICGEMLLEAID